MAGLRPDEVVISVLSFEGPDSYARAGGLAVRVTHLVETLAQRGFLTHLFFVGDPDAPGQEARFDGRLVLHRWCQWISRYHPAGVYDGEEGKRLDFTATVPPYLVEHGIRPALESGRLPVILAEEWHTAEAVIRLDELLRARGWRDRCVILWNANNTMSFHRIDWGRLNAAAQLTTVSRYMKHQMWKLGVNPLVIPNGIPSALLEPVSPERISALRQALGIDERTILLFKAGRFDPAKRWLLAVEAAARLKAMGYRVVFPLRGGIEPHGQEVFAHARALGLTVTHLPGSPASWEDVLRILREAPSADLYSLEFPLPQEWLRPFYAAADAVLAISGHEPFGLIGLEAMAAGGVVFTGATGEEYALDGQGAIVLDTDRPEEIVLRLLDLRAEPGRVEAIREAARRRASDFTWPRVVEILLEKVSFIARACGALPWPKPIFSRPDGRVRDVVIYTIVHQPRRLRLPAQPLPRGASAALLAQGLFDEALNERYFRRAAQRCYDPAIARFQSMLDAGFRMAIGFSLTFLEQAQRWDEELLDRFRDLVRHPHVELVAVEPRHSMLPLWDLPRFIQRMRWAADQLESLFGVRPRVADTTEMMMSPAIYHALDRAGFDAAFLDGRPWVLEWRQPTYLYHHDGGRMKLLARHHRLSDDVGYRFSDRNWEGWPLRADRYAEWLAHHPGDFVVLGWDFETFGEHHREETGIFAFLEALPGEAMRRGLSFRTPSEIIARYGSRSFELPLPAFPSTWAGSGGLEFFLGNEAQYAVFRLMMEAYHMACLTGDPELIELSLYLAQSDNLHMLQWVGRFGPEAEVSAYFTPAEWWALGPDRIVWEVQQVYKNFIAALEVPGPLNREG
ncbi:D-inositol-3-phosphate glycosyltransferase [Candidatus Thermoflexus japonica]|uniref:D-inositol-3-phosphate glycosyltransferase n=1 Tax=Candidatus Thermoflexus japonica TaxID=2035417 RepID=A0A2H5Y388_9CHLR|nr:D-inositol-3-phosphate glycosyltransferase [Candidatus Thermoflexus japonica]